LDFGTEIQALFYWPGNHELRREFGPTVFGEKNSPSQESRAKKKEEDHLLLPGEADHPYFSEYTTRATTRPTAERLAGLVASGVSPRVCQRG